MGEAQNQSFQLSFNTALKIEFQGSRGTSDGGLILVRELDERLGFSDLIAQHLTDPRGTNTQFPLADLGRQSVYWAHLSECDSARFHRHGRGRPRRLRGGHAHGGRRCALVGGANPQDNLRVHRSSRTNRQEHGVPFISPTERLFETSNATPFVKDGIYVRRVRK